MKKKIFSILLSLCMVLTMIPVAAGTVWAEGESSIENVTFGYAYDVQRSNAYPTLGEEVTLSGLTDPIVKSGDRDNRGDSDGVWTLTKAGTYAYMVNSGKYTTNLEGIVNDLSGKYTDTSLDKSAIIIHELKKNGTHIAYGVVVAYGTNDESGNYALFHGDTLGGSGAGYFLTENARRGEFIVTATALFTENLQSRSINLEISSGSDFAMKDEGYGEGDVETKTVTVTNTGATETGDLTVTLSGANANCFEISPTESTISNITSVGGTATFSIKPKKGLAANTYTATVTVSGKDNTDIEAQSLNISFKVNPIVLQRSIKLDVENTYTFHPAEVDYSTRGAKEVTITNTGNVATGDLNVALSSGEESNFTVGSKTIDSIENKNDTATFNVAPKLGLSVGTYTETVTVSGDNIASQSFNVSFTVNPKVPQRSIKLSEEGTYTFPEATVGYSAPAAKEVTITSTGTAATGKLYITLDGANKTSFTLGKNEIESIAVDESATFTVTPKTGLAAGTYTAKVTVGDGNLNLGSFNVSFKVNKASSGGGSHSSSIQKPTIIAGEGAETSLSILGTNLTIKVTEGYELTDVILNGVSKGKVTELTGLRTGDKVEVKTEKKQEKPSKEEIIAALDSSKLVARSKLITLENGKKAVRVTWYDQNGNEIDFDGIEVYRSVKRYKGYGLEPFYTTKGDKSEGYYVNTKDLKEGTTYYYKVRGYVTIDGQKYYTDYSLKAIRTIK